KAGHQVTVVEKEPEAATLATAGNAGLIAPGHSFAWASPTAPKELLRSLTVEDTALRVNPFKAPGMAVWGLRFLRECNAERAVKHKLAGAIYGVTDSSGDSVMFTHKLQAVCERMGSKFLFGKGVVRLATNGGKVRAAMLDGGESVDGEVFVLSAGVHSPRVARTVGVRLPIAPAKGYSATFPVKRNGGPEMRVGAVDEELLVAWCRMRDRLRMTSGAEFTGCAPKASQPPSTTTVSPVTKAASELAR